MNSNSIFMLTIADIAPDRATYRPGEMAHITITLTNHQSTSICGRLVLRLMHLDQVVGEIEQTAEIGPEATMPVVFSLTPPPTPLCGYGLDATLYDDAGRVLAERSGALDVLERWSQAPRYGFLSDF